MKPEGVRRKLATAIVIQAVNNARQPFEVFGHGVLMDAAFLDTAGAAVVSGMTREEFLERCGREWNAIAAATPPSDMAEYAAARAKREGTPS